MNEQDNKSVVESRRTPEVAANKLGQAIGTLFAYIVAGCVCTVLVALTVKFIMWLF